MSTSADFLGPFTAHVLELLPRAEVRVRRRDEVLLLILIAYQSGGQTRISHEASIVELATHEGPLTARAVALARELCSRLQAASGGEQTR